MHQTSDTALDFLPLLTEMVTPVCRKISGPHVCGDALDIEPFTLSLLTGSWRQQDQLEVGSTLHNTSQHSTSHHSTSYHITSQHITSPHITSPHITSQHITSQHITSQHITSQYITSQHITTQCSIVCWCYSVAYNTFSVVQSLLCALCACTYMSLVIQW